MSDAPREAATGPYRRPHGRSRAHRPISIAGLPTPEDLAQQPHSGEDADRFSLYTPQQIDSETRAVRLDITFSDPIKIRDQAEMIMACMRQIIQTTRKHDIGSIRQRIEARQEAASVGRALSRFNGKTPYGEARRKR